MGFAAPVLAPGAVLSAATVRGHRDAALAWLDGGALVGDIDGPFDHQQILAPEVRGSTEAGELRGVTQDVAWCQNLDDALERSWMWRSLSGISYVPVPKLGRTVETRHPSATIRVHASWYAWERDCVNAGAVNVADDVEACRFKLFYRTAGTTYARDHTICSIWNSGTNLWYSARKQCSVVDQLTIPVEGWVSVWVGQLLLANDGVDCISLHSRNIVLDVSYL